MPQLEKYTFFTQLFWFFLLFFAFFLLLLQFVLPSLARSLKFRNKLIKFYNFQLEEKNNLNALMAQESKIIGLSLDVANKFSGLVKSNTQMLKNANISRYDRTRFFSTVYKYEIYKQILTKLMLLKERKKKAYNLARQAFLFPKTLKKLGVVNAVAFMRSRDHAIDVRWYGKKTKG